MVQHLQVLLVFINIYSGPGVWLLPGNKATDEVY